MLRIFFHPNHKVLLTILMSAALFVSCERRPDDVVSRRKMEEILYDYHKAQAMLSHMGDNEENITSAEMINAVFEKHGITEAQFDSSLVWYNAHSEDLKKIYDNLVERYTEENEALALQLGSHELTASLSAEGDTTSLWNGSKVMVLHNNRMQNTEQFQIKADTSFHAHDKFIFFANVIILKGNRNSDSNSLTASLSIISSEGKAFSQVSKISANNTIQLEITKADNTKIKEITGFLHYQGVEGERSLCMIDNIQLIRMHIDDDEEEETDSIATESDSLGIDSAMIVKKPERGERLSPTELLNKQDRKDRIKIKKAPDVRTPNSFGIIRKRR